MTFRARCRSPYKKIYRDPVAMIGILNRILQEGLDLAGIRLLYPTSDQFNIGKFSTGPPSASQSPRTDATRCFDWPNIGAGSAGAVRPDGPGWTCWVHRIPS